MKHMTDIDKGKLSPTPRRWTTSTRVVEEFRANGGKVGGPFEGGSAAPAHQRREIGRIRLSPLACLTSTTRC